MQQPTMARSKPAAAPTIATKLFIAKAMPSKLTQRPAIPSFIPFI